MAEFSDDDLVAFVERLARTEDLAGKTAFVNVVDGRLALYAAVPDKKTNKTFDTYCKAQGKPPIYMLDVSNNNKAGVPVEFDWSIAGEEE